MQNFYIVGTVSKAETLCELLEEPEKLACCDFIELRFDEFMNKQECLDLCRKLRQHRKILLTIRTCREGGTWTIDDNERYALFKYFENDVDAIDIELKSRLFAERSRKDFSTDLLIIGSFHNYETTPADEEISTLIDLGKRWPVDIVKLAVMTTTDDQIERLKGFLTHQNICLIGMGDQGLQTRTGFPKLGSRLTYGFLDQSAAPGQVSAADLRKLLSE